MRSTDAGDDLIQNFLIIAAIILIVTPRPIVSLIGLDSTFYIVKGFLRRIDVYLRRTIVPTR